MPTLPGRRPSTRPPRIVVLGDLVLDVVLAPMRPLETGTDVPGTVALHQGGSAANTARWLARLGARTTLVAAVGRDPAGRALVEQVRADGVIAKVARLAAMRTGRIGVVVAPGGERSFVADRGAADGLTPAALDPTWFRGADALHLPIYSLLAEPLASAARRAIGLARGAGATLSVDLASTGPLMAGGRRSAMGLVESLGPDILLATHDEASAVLGGRPVERLLSVAPVVVIKRGGKGATVLGRTAGDAQNLRFEVATTPLAALDTTGAGDAFDAGFLVSWLQARARGGSVTAGLQRATLAGHRAAARQITGGRQELDLA